jgi:hypothetical protein
VKERVLAIEGAILLVLGAANIVSGQLVGAAILIGIASLAAACAWALWPGRGQIIGLAGEPPRKEGSSPPRRR